MTRADEIAALPDEALNRALAEACLLAIEAVKENER